MHVRLTTTDMRHVDIVQKHFSGLEPLPVRLTTADVVRLGLQELAARIGKPVLTDSKASATLFAQQVKCGSLMMCPPTEVIQQAVDTLIAHQNRPMSAREIYAGFEVVGFTLAGQDPVANLSSKLSREAAKPNGRLRSNGPRGGYQLSEIEALSAHEKGKIHEGSLSL